MVTCFYKSGNQTVEKEVVVAEFIEVKGWKALGNKLHEGKLTKVVKVSPVAEENEDAAEISIGLTPSEEQPVPKIDFPVKQGKLFEDNEDEGPKDNPKKTIDFRQEIR